MLSLDFVKRASAKQLMSCDFLRETNWNEVLNDVGQSSLKTEAVPNGWEEFLTSAKYQEYDDFPELDSDDDEEDNDDEDAEML
tara:strand:- start:1616 stop:1864 length:249 start_codon:yes stop_codon:yes gene_type:complete